MTFLWPGRESFPAIVERAIFGFSRPQAGLCFVYQIQSSFLGGFRNPAKICYSPTLCIKSVLINTFLYGSNRTLDLFSVKRSYLSRAFGLKKLKLTITSKFLL